MSSFKKNAGLVLNVLLLAAFLSSSFAFGVYEKPGKSRGNARKHGGAPEITLGILVATGLASTGLMYAKRRRGRKD
jgi:hypothetical protein